MNIPSEEPGQGLPNWHQLSAAVTTVCPSGDQHPVAVCAWYLGLLYRSDCPKTFVEPLRAQMIRRIDRWAAENVRPQPLSIGSYIDQFAAVAAEMQRALGSDTPIADGVHRALMAVAELADGWSDIAAAATPQHYCRGLPGEC